jgi:hypothetical protein
MLRRNFFLLLVFVLVLSIHEASAQCAMCKAVAGSSVEAEANDVGKGLNTGILYLMSVPYLILMALFFIFFKEKIIAKFRAFKLNN